MRCRFCTSDEDLKWPTPYVKACRPIRELDGKAHICKENNVIELGQQNFKKDIEKCMICGKPFTNEWKGHLHKV